MTIELIVAQAQQVITADKWRHGNAGEQWLIALETGGKVYRYWFKKDPNQREIDLLISTMQRDIRLGRGELIKEQKVVEVEDDDSFDDEATD